MEPWNYKTLIGPVPDFPGRFCGNAFFKLRHDFETKNGF